MILPSTKEEKKPTELSLFSHYPFPTRRQEDLTSPSTPDRLFYSNFQGISLFTLRATRFTTQHYYARPIIITLYLRFVRILYCTAHTSRLGSKLTPPFSSHHTNHPSLDIKQVATAAASNSSSSPLNRPRWCPDYTALRDENLQTHMYVGASCQLAQSVLINQSRLESFVISQTYSAISLHKRVKYPLQPNLHTHQNLQYYPGRSFSLHDLLQTCVLIYCCIIKSTSLDLASVVDHHQQTPLHAALILPVDCRGSATPYSILVQEPQAPHLQIGYDVTFRPYVKPGELG